MTARSDESNRGPAIACAILKRARGEWATALELADEAQCAPRVALAWAREMAELGLLKNRISPRRGARGAPPNEFRLATHWGGL